MTGRPEPTVYLQDGSNPWGKTLEDTVLEGLILDAARQGERHIQEWIKAEEVAPDAVFAQVILDPTNSRDSGYSIEERILAIVLYGDPAKALECLPNAAAKADATDRHGGRWTNGELVEKWSFGLCDDDFAWGDTAMFGPAISAGSGLKVHQDKELAALVLMLLMTEVHKRRVAWLAAQRENGGRQGWYNPENIPGRNYQIDLSNRNYWRMVVAPTS